MESEKIKEIETQIAHFQKIENDLTSEAKQVLLSEINTLVLALNKDVEEYLLKMKQIETTQV